MENEKRYRSKFIATMTNIENNIKQMKTETTLGMLEKGIMSLTLQQPVDADQVKKIPTGLRELDFALHGGIHTGGYTVLASSEGTGKTTLTVQMVRGCVESGHKAFVISDEDGVERWCAQFIRMVVGPRWLDESDRTRTIPRVYKDAELFARAYYADSIAFASPYEMENKTWEGLKNKIIEYAGKGYELFVLDNLMVLTGLLAGDGTYGGARDVYQMQSKVCADLRNLGKALKIAIVLIQHKGKYKSREEDQMSSQDGSGTQDVGNAAMMYLHWVAYNEQEMEKVNSNILKYYERKFGLSGEEIKKHPYSWENDEKSQKQRMAFNAYNADTITKQTDRRIICTKDRLYGQPFFKRTLHYDERTGRYYHDELDDRADSWEVAFETEYIPMIIKQELGEFDESKYSVHLAVAQWIDEKNYEIEQQEKEQNKVKKTGIALYEGITKFLKSKLHLITDENGKLGGEKNGTQI